MYSEIKENIAKLSEAIGNIELRAKNESRELTAKETGLVCEMEAEIKHLKMSLPGPVLTMPGNGPLGSRSVVYENNPVEMARAVTDRSYKSMFCRGNARPLDDGGFRSDEEFFNVILSGRYDPRLQVRAAMTETVPSEGGFSVPSQFASQWLDASLPAEIARNRAKVYPMTSETLKVPAWDAKDFSSGEYAGLKMQFLAESAVGDKQTAKMRQITLTAHTGAIYVDASLELVGDGLNFADQLRAAMIKAIAYGLDRHCIGSAGTGAGCPQSIQIAPCLVSIDGESGQASGTIQYANLKKMYARQLNPDKAVFMFNNQAIPDLLELNIAVGTGGAPVPVLNQSGDGRFTILGRPAIATTHLPTIGSANCVMFVDWDFYSMGLRADVVLDMTDSHRWTQRERSFRVIIRFDGQSTLDGPITPENGDTLSPVVGIAAI